METNTKEVQQDTEYYQRVVTCRRRGNNETHYYHFPIDVTCEEVKAVLLEKEGFSFRVDELLETGDLLTAHHKLHTDIRAKKSVQRMPINNETYVVLMGIKYLLNRGMPYAKAVDIMRGYTTITIQNEEDFWSIIASKDFLDRAELIAYTA